jgi:hypothetical protein
MTTGRIGEPPPIACDLTAIDGAQREAHMKLAERLLTQAPAEVRELADGYAFRYASELYSSIAEFVANERLCCPFFAFTIEVTPERGPVWLRITGPDGVKAFLQAQL